VIHHTSNQVDINRNAIVELIVFRRIFSEQGKFNKSQTLMRFP